MPALPGMQAFIINHLGQLYVFLNKNSTRVKIASNLAIGCIFQQHLNWRRLNMGNNLENVPLK